MIKKYIGIVLIVLAVLLINDLFLIWGLSGNGSSSFGGIVHIAAEYFPGGLGGGQDQRLLINSSGNFTAGSSTATFGTSTLGNTVLNNKVLSLSLVSSTSATTLTGSQFCGNGLITVTNNGSQTTSTITFPVATSTFATCMTNLGSVRTISLQNTSSSAFIITIASSTGVTMVKPFNVSSTFTVIGGGVTNLRLIQITSSTALLSVDRQQ